MDDGAIRPVGPQMQPDPLVDFDDQAIAEDKQVAAAYFHPAWIKVEQDFLVEINRLNDVSSLDLKQSSDELKVAVQANLRAADLLKSILGRVKDAVEAVESVERTKEGDSQ